MSLALSVITDARNETVAQRIRRLQAEAKSLARDHVHALVHSLAEAAELAHEIANGGDAYPAGVRDLARRFVDDVAGRMSNIEALIGRPA